MKRFDLNRKNMAPVFPALIFALYSLDIYHRRKLSFALIRAVGDINRFSTYHLMHLRKFGYAYLDAVAVRLINRKRAFLRRN